MTTVRYYLPDNGQTAADAYEIDKFGPGRTEWQAEEAAQDYYDNHDGWEDSWPVRIAICGATTASGDDEVFEVGMEARPVFSASSCT